MSQVATKSSAQAWADIAKGMSFMGTKDEAGNSKSILEKAELNDACLKKLAAFAKALSQGHSSTQCEPHG